MQLFRGLCFKATLAKYNAHILSREYRTEVTTRIEVRDGKIKVIRNPLWENIFFFWPWYISFLICVGMLQGLYMLTNFLSFFQFIMSLVQFRIFAANHGWHPDTPDCNSVTGFENWDMYLARATTVCAYYLILPALYEISRVICPYEPIPVKDSRGNVEKWEEIPERAKLSSSNRKYMSDVVHQEAMNNSNHNNHNNESPPLSKIVSDLPLTSLVKLPIALVSPDLWLAHLTGGLLSILPSLEKEKMSINTPLSKTVDKMPEDADEEDGRDNPHDSCWNRIYKYFTSFIKDVLITVPPPTQIEMDLWKTEEHQVYFPSFLGLLKLELHDLFCEHRYFEPKRNKREKNYPPLGYFCCFLLFLFPIGHVFSTRGRQLWIMAFRKNTIFSSQPWVIGTISLTRHSTYTTKSKTSAELKMTATATTATRI